MPTRRDYLTRSKTICLKTDTGSEVEFTILKKINEGGSSVCYKACCGKSAVGILKEFYPRGYTLKRDGDGQLIYSGGAKGPVSFAQAKEAHLAAYESLKIKQDGDLAEQLSFIPPAKILYGCVGPEDVGTVYVWTEEAERKTFEEICRENHAHPTENPEYKLALTLYAIRALTERVRNLHKAGFIHRDIKPDNFGFYVVNEQTQYQTLSIFDISSLLDIKSDWTSPSVGTDGYLEPEVERGDYRATNQTDIYSIGATLFRAIVVRDKEEEKAVGTTYRPEDRDRLEELVRDSKLIRASEDNSNPRLCRYLADVLRGCLSPRGKRYEDCEALLEGLNKALQYVFPPEYLRALKGMTPKALAEMKQVLDQNEKKNSLQALQYHLYRVPLYQAVQGGQEKPDSLRVMLVGFGNYGQKFLDACLQAGQLPDQKLEVTVLADELREADRESYLKARPALDQFFRVDGVLKAENGAPAEVADEEDVYGSITFTQQRLERNVKANEKLLLNVIGDMDHVPNYIFVALGEDGLNRSAAIACMEAAKLLETRCVVSYVCEREESPEEEREEGLYPVYVNRDIKKDPLHKEIERMAFNAHLIWEKSLNTDYKKVRREFRKPYNHDSCVGNVISMKYKLYSLGISLDDPDRAASLFREKLAKNKDRLIWVEHRRWVTEKLCQGWRRQVINKKCLVEGGTRDKRAKTHICIVRSKPNQMLKEHPGYWKKDSTWKENLDELDQMSVALHLLLQEEAEKVKGDLLEGEVVTELREQLTENRKAIAAFEEWHACMAEIWNGDRKKVRLYAGLKASLLAAAGQDPEIEKKVKRLHEDFYPALAGAERRDWKQDDVMLVERIPFILTYTSQLALVIPFVRGDSSTVFQNVAAATVMNPARILYVYRLNEPKKRGKDELSELRDSLSAVMGYLRHKNLRAAVELILAYRTGDDSRKAELEAWLSEEEQKAWNIKFTELELEDRDQLPARFAECLKLRGGLKFILERNDTAAGEQLKDLLPWYSFDAAEMRFSQDSPCAMQCYLNTDACYITVEDMLRLSRSICHERSLPSFDREYEKLWKMYKKRSPAVWKSLCNVLKGRRQECKEVPLEAGKTPNTEKREYLLPSLCGKGAKKILDFLREKEMVGDQSKVLGHSAGFCEVLIYPVCETKAKYDKIFHNLNGLAFPDLITLSVSTNKKNAVKKDVTVKFGELFSELRVENVDIAGADAARTEQEKKKGQTVKNLLRDLEEIHYIFGLEIKENDTLASFTYAEPSVRELLTTDGKLLEVYIYHKLKATGAFDDVVSGYKVGWGDTKVYNEFDCIATKGFRSLFIECKATSKLNNDFYTKLDSLSRKFAVNGTAVLIADVAETKDEAEKICGATRQRGDMMKIVTISSPEELNRIDETLLKIIDGTYGA